MKKVMIVCKNCGEEFRNKYSRLTKFCSKGCYSEHQKSNPNSGTFKKGHKSFKKGKTWEEIYGEKKAKELKNKITERRKGKTYKESFGEEKAKEWKMNLSKVRKGKNHPRWGIKLKDEIREKISNSLKGRDFESLHGKKKSEEIKKKMSKRFKGERNPNFNGWSSLEPYDKNFNDRFKRTIRKRDNQVCILCGIHREKYKKSFDIHHINYDKKISIPQNCVSLCNLCHLITNMNRRCWTKFFQSLLAEKYGYEYLESGEIVLEVKNEI